MASISTETDDELLGRIDVVLRHAGFVESGRSAKLERALGTEPAASRSGEALTRRSPAGLVVRAYLREQAATLRRLDPLVRRDEPDAVHQMRVTTRRLRSTLRTFEAVLPASARRTAADLKWLGGLLGAARDAEVLAGHLSAIVGELPAELVLGPVAARLTGHFAPRRAAARADLLAALGSGRYLDLLDALDALCCGRPGGRAAARPAASELRKALRRPRRKAGAAMRRARDARDDAARDAALHQARKAAKRARYGAEVAAPVLGGDARRFGRQMKELQSVLGDHQDTVMARPVIRHIAVTAWQSGENAFSYGLMYQRDAEAAVGLRRRARRVWRKASRRRWPD